MSNGAYTANGATNGYIYVIGSYNGDYYISYAQIAGQQSNNGISPYYNINSWSQASKIVAEPPKFGLNPIIGVINNILNPVPTPSGPTAILYLMSPVTTDVLYINLNADGSLSNSGWQTALNNTFMTSYSSTAVCLVNNGYLYVLGSNNGLSLLVSYAKIATSGEVGQWQQQTVQLSAKLLKFSAVINNDSIYIVSGTNGVSDFYIPLSAIDGSPGSMQNLFTNISDIGANFRTVSSQTMLFNFVSTSNAQNIYFNNVNLDGNLHKWMREKSFTLPAMVNPNSVVVNFIDTEPNVIGIFQFFACDVNGNMYSTAFNFRYPCASQYLNVWILTLTNGNYLDGQSPGLTYNGAVDNIMPAPYLIVPASKTSGLQTLPAGLTIGRELTILYLYLYGTPTQNGVFVGQAYTLSYNQPGLLISFNTFGLNLTINPS